MCGIGITSSRLINSGVGKSCLLIQYTQNRFSPTQPTLGLEAVTKEITIKKRKVTLKIWDSAGQEHFRSVTRSYYKNKICAFLVYDVTDKKSFEDVKVWLNEIKDNSHSLIQLVLIGNKCELKSKRKVSVKEAAEFAMFHKMFFFETSAKENINITKAFEVVILRILSWVQKGKLNPYVGGQGIGFSTEKSRKGLLQKNYNKKHGSNCC